MFMMFCGVAFLPAMRCAGSPPGTTMKIRKTTKLTAMHTRIMPIMRLMRNAATLSARS